MTVHQLIDWLFRAKAIHKVSFDNNTKEYKICEVQSLIQTAPTKNPHRYCANTGELQLATTLMFMCSLEEIREMADKCWINAPIDNTGSTFKNPMIETLGEDVRPIIEFARDNVGNNIAEDIIRPRVFEMDLIDDWNYEGAEG